jgi:hypothetical protein
MEGFSMARSSLPYAIAQWLLSTLFNVCIGYLIVVVVWPLLGEVIRAVLTRVRG